MEDCRRKGSSIPVDIKIAPITRKQPRKGFMGSQKYVATKSKAAIPSHAVMIQGMSVSKMSRAMTSGNLLNNKVDTQAIKISMVCLEDGAMASSFSSVTY